MYVVRDIMFCKPGKVRALVDKYKAMNALGVKSGMPNMRIMTDLSSERYWMVVSEMEVPDLKSFEEMMSAPNMAREDMKKMEEIMTGYHDLVDHGRREIYKLES